MRHIALIACAKGKQDVRCKAADLYVSDLFRKSLAYARSFTPDAIYILSAKHGLLPLDKEVDPYEQTLNAASREQVKAWADRVLGQLGQVADLSEDRFTVLASERYRRHLIPALPNHTVPMQGLGIGQQLAYLNKRSGMTDPANATCHRLHQWLHSRPRHRFPFDSKSVPADGIYLLFEKGEHGHGGDRIVRVGTHTGHAQLRSRLKQHFLIENKDRSIFRKNIGRALLTQANDPFTLLWEHDLTSNVGKKQYAHFVDVKRRQEVERAVTERIQQTFSFAVLPVSAKVDRLRLESRLVSTVARCGGCGPSADWLGRHSPKEKIRASGLWQVNELYKEPLVDDELRALIEQG